MNKERRRFCGNAERYTNMFYVSPYLATIYKEKERAKTKIQCRKKKNIHIKTKWHGADNVHFRNEKRAGFHVKVWPTIGSIDHSS